MSNSAKNLLQEYFQSEGLALPTYDTGRAGGEDHKPLWISRVVLPNGTGFMSRETFPSKAAAEKSAAAVALEEITPQRSEGADGVWKNKGESLCYIMIDVENMSRVALDVLKTIKRAGSPPPCNQLMFFMSKGCPLAERITSELKECGLVCVRITDSLLPDAADMLICMEATMELSRGNDVIIVSNDRFARTFVAVATESMDSIDSATSETEDVSSRIRNMTSQGELMDWLIN